MLFTPRPDGGTYKGCDKCRATQRTNHKKHYAKNRAKIAKKNAKNNPKYNPKYNPKNNAKTALALAETKMKIAAENAQLRDEASPPTQPEIDAIANALILGHSDLLDTIVKQKQGVYIALCSQHTKKDEPFMGAARSALTKISSSKPPTVTELKTTWSPVSLRDFPYHISAMQLETALHQKLQAELA